MGLQNCFRNLTLNRNFYEISRILLFKRCYAGDFSPADEPEIPDVTLLDEKPLYDDTVDTEKIERQRNKSLLNEPHRRLLNGEPPYDEEFIPYHHTLTYKRRLLGTYGLEKTNLPAGIAWPTEDEINDIKEYECVKYPLTLQEAWAEIAKKREKEAAAKKARDEEIAKKMLNVDKWKSDLKARIEKKAAEVAAAKAKKERMIEEVRRHIGFEISIKDERFKEMLAKKEKEDKKLKRETKRKEKTAKLMAKLLEKNAAKSNKEGAPQAPEEEPKNVPTNTA